MKQHRWIYYYGAAAIGLLAGVWSARAEVRFDHIVRNDFFSGFTGNAEALTRGMNVCEQVLAANPNHAEALVWHGAGLFFQSGQLFQQGKREEGMQLSARGMAEMDKSVALAPDDIGVRIPRGAALLAAARFMPDNPFRAGLFQRRQQLFQAKVAPRDDAARNGQAAHLIVNLREYGDAHGCSSYSRLSHMSWRQAASLSI